MSREVTIYSGGHGRDTQIVDEDGQKLEWVSAASIQIEPSSHNEVTLEVRAVRLNVKGTITEVLFVCPCCGQSFTHECDDPDGSLIANPSINSTPVPAPTSLGTPSNPLMFDNPTCVVSQLQPGSRSNCTVQVEGAPSNDPSRRYKFKCDGGDGHTKPRHHDPVADLWWIAKMP